MKNLISRSVATTLVPVAALAAVGLGPTAAASADGVRHLVTRESANLSGRSVTGFALQWLEDDKVLHRSFRGGRLLFEAYLDTTGYYAFDPAENTLTHRVGARLLDAGDPIANGVPAMRRAGSGRIDGRKVRRYVDLRHPASIRPALTRQVFVDERTNRIVRDQLLDRAGRVRVRTDVLVDEVLAKTPGNQALLARPEHPGASEIIEADERRDRP